MNIDWIVTGKATILGLVQGLTEFLPVSSTGHLVLVEKWLHFMSKEKGEAFDVFVHLGTLLAICAAYCSRLDRSGAALMRGDRAEWRFWILVGIAAAPALLAGKFFSDFFEEHLHKPVPVACALILGALAIFVIEHWYRQRQARGIEAAVKDMEEVTPLQAVKIGCVQVLALIPGVSRSGSTIMGGMTFGVSRTAATDFTFFVAMPTLLAAAGYKLYKYHSYLSPQDAIPFTAGFLVAFLSALLVVKWLLRFIATHDFRPFAWYRLALGAAVLAECLLRGHG